MNWTKFNWQFSKTWARNGFEISAFNHISFDNGLHSLMGATSHHHIAIISQSMSVGVSKYAAGWLHCPRLSTLTQVDSLKSMHLLSNVQDPLFNMNFQNLFFSFNIILPRHLHFEEVSVYHFWLAINMISVDKTSSIN